MVGVLTVDLNPLGIVMTSDSQKVDLYADHFRVHVGGTKNESPIVRAHLSGFSGWAGSVGTAVIGGKSSRDWLRQAGCARSSMTLSELCGDAANELSGIWKSQEATHLSIFVAGYEKDEPRFWWIDNGDVTAGSPISSTFGPVNDLDEHWLREHAAVGESKSDAIARKQPRFRRGVLDAVNLFDSFTQLVSDTIQAGHDQIPAIDSLERYAAYAKFRFEFAKRMYDTKYGIGVDPYPPIGGDIHVFSVDPGGTARDHKKHVFQSKVVP